MTVRDYLVVELPRMDEAPAIFSATHPHVTIDQIIGEAVVAGRPAYQLTTFAWGLKVGEIDELVAALHAEYPDLRTLRRDAAAGNWLGTFLMPADWLSDPGAVAVNGFVQEHGLTPRWLRLEQGRVFAKVRLPQGMDAQGMAQRLRGFMEGRRIDGDVAVEVGSSDHLGPWAVLADVLTEQGISLPPGLADLTG